jgi:hypothetical protein
MLLTDLMIILQFSHNRQGQCLQLHQAEAPYGKQAVADILVFSLNLHSLSTFVSIIGLPLTSWRIVLEA